MNTNMIIVFIAVVAFAQCIESSSVLTRFNLTAVSKEALCNDGSDAVYYHRAGTGSGATKWIIRLQGGGWCFDVESCKNRASGSPYWTSSNQCLAEIDDNKPIGPAGHGAHEGILSSNETLNPYFYNYNHVYVWYCSSDSFSGRSPKVGPNTNYFQFNGKAIIRALIVHLFKFQEFKSATDVLLSGDSAGGVATFSNVDYIEDLIRPNLPKVHYRGFVDAGWFVDIPTYNPASSSFREIAQGLYNNWNVQFNDACMAKYKGEEWRCFHAQYAHTFIRTPTFYQEFQFDSANLDFDGVHKPFDGPAMDYVMGMRANMTLTTLAVPYFFYPSCNWHETIDGPLWTNVQIENKSIAEGVAKWFSDKTPVPLATRSVDTCEPFACNPTCIR